MTIRLLSGNQVAPNVYKLFFVFVALAVSLAPLIDQGDQAAVIVAWILGVTVGLPFTLYGIAWIWRALEARACRISVEHGYVRVIGGRLDGLVVAVHELVHPGVWLEEGSERRFTLARVWIWTVFNLVFLLLLLGSSGRHDIPALERVLSPRTSVPTTKLWLLGRHSNVLVASTSDPEEMQTLRAAVGEVYAALVAVR